MVYPHRQPVAPLDVGRVLARTWGVLWRQGIVIFPVAILLQWLPNAAQAQVLTNLAEPLPHLAYAAFVTAAWLLFPLADMMVVVAAVATLGGRRIGFSQALWGAVTVYPAALGLDILQNLTSLATTWLLGASAPENLRLGAEIVHVGYGLASAAILLPSLAAAAQERLGFRSALARTVALTAGNRLRVGLIGALFLALQQVLATVLQGLIVALLGAQGPVLWLSLLPSALIFAYGSTAQAVIYWDLARLRDGVAPEELDRVFS
jgi:hypothetical protein